MIPVLASAASVAGLLFTGYAAGRMDAEGELMRGVRHVVGGVIEGVGWLVEKAGSGISELGEWIRPGEENRGASVPGDAGTENAKGLTYEEMSLLVGYTMFKLDMLQKQGAINDEEVRRVSQGLVHFLAEQGLSGEEVKRMAEKWAKKLEEGHVIDSSQAERVVDKAEMLGYALDDYLDQKAIKSNTMPMQRYI